MKGGSQLNTSQISTSNYSNQTIQSKLKHQDPTSAAACATVSASFRVSASAALAAERTKTIKFYKIGMEKRDGIWESQNLSIIELQSYAVGAGSGDIAKHSGLPVSLPLSQRFQLLLWQQPPGIKQCYPEPSWSLRWDMNKHQPTVKKTFL